MWQKERRRKVKMGRGRNGGKADSNDGKGGEKKRR